jgi:hypothetical protein
VGRAGAKGHLGKLELNSPPFLSVKTIFISRLGELAVHKDLPPPLWTVRVLMGVVFQPFLVLGPLPAGFILLVCVAAALLYLGMFSLSQW